MTDLETLHVIGSVVQIGPVDEPESSSLNLVDDANRIHPALVLRTVGFHVATGVIYNTVESPGTQRLEHGVGFFGCVSGGQSACRNTGFLQRTHLIPHECDER